MILSEINPSHKYIFYTLLVTLTSSDPAMSMIIISTCGNWRDCSWYLLRSDLPQRLTF